MRVFVVMNRGLIDDERYLIGVFSDQQKAEARATMAREAFDADEDEIEILEVELDH